MFDHIPPVAGIYAIVNMLNGHRYVGQAKNMNARVRSHVRELDKGTHRTSEKRLLQNAWNEFGREAFCIVNDMAIGFPAHFKRSRTYHLMGDELAALAKAALENLGWSYDVLSDKEFLASLPFSGWTWGEEVKVKILPGGVIEAD